MAVAVALRRRRNLFLGILAGIIIFAIASSHQAGLLDTSKPTWALQKASTYLSDRLPQRENFMCDRCLVDPEICAKFGTKNIDLSRAFDGTGGRVQRVLKKAMAGEPITISAMGGSISQAHGCDCASWQFRVFDWWNATFPHPENKIVDGSVGARGSDYFMFCHREHIPPDETDLVVMEMSVNDYLMDEAAFTNFETLLRGVLGYPKHPAVIVLQTMHVQGKSVNGGDAHLSTCGYYDVPVINVRNYLFPKFMANFTTAQDWFNWDIIHGGKLLKVAGDKLHPKDPGHEIMAQLINIYLAQQLCFIKNERPVIPPSDHNLVTQDAERDIDKIPRVRLNQKIEDDNFEQDTIPNCRSVDSEKSPLYPVKDQTHGWELYTKSISRAKKFLRATEYGAVITFEVKTTVGEVNAYYLRSNTMGLGAVDCWLDDDKNHRETVDGWWDRQENVGQFQRLFKNKQVSPGNHLLHCEVVDKSRNPDNDNKKTFLFIGVFSV